MKKDCHGHLLNELDLKGLPFEKEIGFIEHYFTVPDVVGIALGRRNFKTGKLFSFIERDKQNNSIDLLTKSMEQLTLAEKIFNVRNEGTLEIEMWVYYYLMYDVKESTKNLPTFTSGNIFGHVINGEYKNTYEILLSNEDSYLRFSFDYSSSSTSMYSMLSCIKDWMQEGMNSDCEIEEFNQLIKIQDGNKFIHMYDEVGESFDIEIGSIEEVLSWISSIRCIGSTFVEHE